MATDAYGNVLGEQYFFEVNGKILTASVPMKGVDTIYNHIGDSFAYLCMIMVIVTILLSVYTAIRAKMSMAEEKN